MSGKYPAIVVENDYSLEGCPCKGAIQVICPELLGYKTLPIDGMEPAQILELCIVSNWVRPEWQGALDFHTPAKGEGVYIEPLRGGDIMSMIWSGCYPSEDFMNLFTLEIVEGINTNVALVTDRIIGARNGSYIKIEDMPDGKLIIEVYGANKAKPDRKGCKLILDGKEGSEKVEVLAQNKDGSKINELKIDMAADTLTLLHNDTTQIEIKPDTIEAKNKSGNSIKISADGIESKDKDGNDIKTSSTGVDVKDKTGNTLKLSDAGIDIKDTNGNELKIGADGITLKTSDSAPWKPNIIQACLFTGAPHSTITMLKGK